MGYAGQISLGHAGFFAIGGYAAAALTTADLGPPRGGGASVLAGSTSWCRAPNPYGGADVCRSILGGASPPRSLLALAIALCWACPS